MRISESINAGYNASSITNSLFSGLNNGNSALNSLYLDYANMRNGSYQKLLKSVYSDKKTQTGSQITQVKENFESISKNASSLKKSASALSSADLYAEGADKTKLTSAVKQFVTDYNNTVSSLNSTSSTDLLRRGVWMTNETKANSKLLSQVGITADKDGKLKVDEEKLKNADTNALKSLFTGANSYADRMSQKGSQLAASSSNYQSALPKVYNKDGQYSVSLPNGYSYNARA